MKKYFMPTNLNALIRYKQIDTCLRNPYIDSTISMLQEYCTESLGEKRGVYKLVSERTIRDDIRVMRSDILGFNAPIMVENGKYIYSDIDYSIFTIQIKEIDLLKEILKLLLEEKKNIVNKDVNILLLKISKIVGEPLPISEIKLEGKIDLIHFEKKKFSKIGPRKFEILKSTAEKINQSKRKRPSIKPHPQIKDVEMERINEVDSTKDTHELVLWHEILDTLNFLPKQA
jgi:hydroxymethylpyrimidine pyrophosphatase-like HAD family hydrolase